VKGEEKGTRQMSSLPAVSRSLALLPNKGYRLKLRYVFKQLRSSCWLKAGTEQPLA